MPASSRMATRAEACSHILASRRATAATLRDERTLHFRWQSSAIIAPPMSTLTEERTSVWATIREALRGAHIDYTTAPVGRAVIMLAVPMVVEMSMESIFAV